MTAPTNKNFDKVFRRLTELGFLHVSGAEIPSVRSLITSRTSKGSWWADPASHQIFQVNQMLEDHPDVMTTKLISGKLTFVHRSLWSRLFSIAVALEDWQLRNLPASAELLLREVEKFGSLSTHRLDFATGIKIGDAARELELRLLVYAEQVHTESGMHAKQIATWKTWAKRENFKARLSPPSSARNFFEKRLAEVNRKYSGHGRLPWPSKTQ